MTQTALETLLGRARGPLGANAEVDFGPATGPFAELGRMLSRLNGFFAFDAGVQVFHAGGPGVGPELVTWNDESTWKHTYEGLTGETFCFGQDVLGTQFAIMHEHVVSLDPETAQVRVIGPSLESWAAWLLDDPPVNATANLARAWQDEHGALGPDERLIPRQFFVLGGGYELDNLIARDAATAMRIRGPIAVQLKGLPDGAQVNLSVAE
ncbi:hypothetical protein ACN28C_10595 [Plantactinospora sp. WMMC1484]|uniref:hypothetical protein n=1 Tax=Plantactinospora sp. WMMC1484 TaxID=3404122 RepID=UPI003BF4E068